MRLSNAWYDPECGDDRLTTPFEDWCEARGVHPENPTAWHHYTWATARPAVLQ